MFKIWGILKPFKPIVFVFNEYWMFELKEFKLSLQWVISSVYYKNHHLGENVSVS